MEAKYGTCRGIKYLIRSPRELWLVYFLKTVSVVTFVATMVSLPLYLTKIQGLSDTTAGIALALLGLLYIIYSLVLGGIPDKVGIRWTLRVATLVSCTSYALYVFVENSMVQILSALLLMTPGFTMSIPACSALGAIVVDAVLSNWGLAPDSFRLIFVGGTLLLGLAFVASLCLRDDPQADIGLLEPLTAVSILKHSASALCSPAMFRLVCVNCLVALSRTVITHAKITLPLFMYRELGEDAHFGYMLGVLQVSIVVFTPLFTCLVPYFNHYSLLILGSFCSSLAPLFFTLGSSYSTVTGFLIVCAVGEAIYSPRLIQYALQVAPHGKETVFLAISATPMAISMMISGLEAGPLLESYCPASPPRDCWVMWVAIAGFSSLSTVFLLLLRRVLEEHARE